MSDDNNSDSSTSDSDVSVYGYKFDPLKALYSPKVKIPVEDAPMFESVQQFECAQSFSEIIPVGQRDLVLQREEQKRNEKVLKEKELEEKNKQRFSKYEVLAENPRREKKGKNVLTRLENYEGPLATLRDCVDRKIRVRIVTRNATGVRGELHANLVAFDKQWNLALTDVLEVWNKKKVKKRKVIPVSGEPVEEGTAASAYNMPKSYETPIGKGVWQCTRHIPQLMMRGEHVVLINIVDRK